MDKIGKERLAVAHVKLGLISPLLNGTYPDASKAAYRRRISEVPVEIQRRAPPRGRASPLRSNADIGIRQVKNEPTCRPTPNHAGAESFDANEPGRSGGTRTHISEDGGF